MLLSLSEVFASLAEPFASSESLETATARCFEALGYHDYALCEIATPGGCASAQVLAGGRRRAWWDRYAQAGYRRRDSLVTCADRTRRALTWTELQADEDAATGARCVAEEARSFGIEDVFIAPIAGVNGSTLAVVLCASSPIPAETDLRATSLAAALLYANQAQAVRRCSLGHGVGEGPLSGREIDCLAWSSEGKSATDIGLLLGISRRTVETHLASTQRKLGVRTTIQAVLKAVRMGALPHP